MSTRSTSTTGAGGRLGRWLLFLAAFLAASPLRAQHAHLNAGALGNAKGDPLSFINGAGFVADSGYLVPLAPPTQGQYSNSFFGSITLTSLPGTSANGGPTFGNARPGTHVVAEVQQVDGPPAGTFSLWEEDPTTGQSLFSFALPTRTPLSGTAFTLSENDGLAGQDPFGHIHGRIFTATHAGLYTLWLRLVDTSNINGAGPQHSPSEPFPLQFQAGTSIHTIERTNTLVTVRFGAQLRTRCWLEATDKLTPPVTWTQIDGPVTGVAHVLSLSDTNAPVGTRFYRIRSEGP